MKTKKVLLLLSIFALSLTSCMDGDDGLASFRTINDSGNGYNVYYSDPNLPATMYYDTFYPTKAGTYSYSYDYGFYNYSGFYTIEQEKGEEWNAVTYGVLSTPASGKDRKYTFDLDAASGSELTYTRVQMENHQDIIINKVFYFEGGKIIVKGKGVYDLNHTLSRKSTQVQNK